MRLRILVGLVWAIGGCAHRSQFTSADELRQLTEAPRPEKAFSAASIDLPQFDLQGPFAAGAEVHETASPWSALLVASAPGRYEVDGALGCAARELARFSVQHKGNPARPLEAFALGRCGSAASYTASNTLSGEVPASVTEAQLWAQWKPEVVKILATLQPGERAGIALAREQGRAWLTLLHHPTLARLKPSARIPDEEGKIVIEGQLAVAAEKIEALINQGAVGWSQCLADPGVKLPAFRVSCTANKEDPQAWLTVSAWEAGRVLGKEVAKVLVWPAGQAADVYLARVWAKAGPPSAEAFVERLNAVRTTAGMAPLTLIGPQSVTAASVAPYFFGGRDGPLKDKIALGLMAGWDVGGLVSSGSFHGDWTPQADSAALLSSMLDSPSGRRSLLSPRASRIAAGMLKEGDTLGGLISAYEMFPDVDPVEAPRKLIDSLNAARAKRGKGPAEWIANPNDFYVRAAKALLDNQLTPAEAAELFMNETVQFTRRPVRGLTQTLSDLAQVQWAEEVLAHPAPQVLVFVGVQQAPGEAWAQYVVLVLLLEGMPGGPQT